MKKVETLTAAFSALCEESGKEKEAHRKEVESLDARIKELTAQVAWLNGQLYGRKCEKLRVYDPNYADMSAAEFGELLKQAEEKREEAVGGCRRMTNRRQGGRARCAGCWRSLP